MIPWKLPDEEETILTMKRAACDKCSLLGLELLMRLMSFISLLVCLIPIINLTLFFSRPNFKSKNERSITWRNNNLNSRETWRKHCFVNYLKPIRFSFVVCNQLVLTCFPHIPQFRVVPFGLNLTKLYPKSDSSCILVYHQFHFLSSIYEEYSENKKTQSNVKLVPKLLN